MEDTTLTGIIIQLKNKVEKMNKKQTLIERMLLAQTILFVLIAAMILTSSLV